MQKRKERTLEITIYITVWTDFMQDFFKSYIVLTLEAMKKYIVVKKLKTKINYSITIDNEKTNTKNRPIKARQE